VPDDHILFGSENQRYINKVGRLHINTLTENRHVDTVVLT
jgi:hypothetical protein